MVVDIVLICDDKCIPRNQCQLGKVGELIIGKNGNIRRAKLVVVSKSGSRNTCYCPIQKLVHFKIDYKSEELTDKEKDEINKNEVEADKGHKSDIKSTRKAAIA